jgi:serine/alanine adding enzyme
MRVIREPDRAAWQGFVQDQPGANIFHTLEMRETFARAKGHRPDVWAAVGDDSRIAALLTPVHITLYGGLLKRLTTRSIAYGGILAPETPDGDAALRLLLMRYGQEQRSRSLFTEIRHLDPLGARRSLLEACGYRYEEHLDFLLPLERPADVVLARMGKKTRYEIRRALRDKAITISRVERRSSIPAAYALLRETYARARIPLADISLFEAAFDVLAPRGMILILLAHVDGVPAACSMELLFRRTIYGWYAGFDRTFRRHLLNEALTWWILRWGAENGYERYDFGGAGRPHEAYGVRNFKAKFGGIPVEYGRSVQVHDPLVLRVSETAYRAARSIVGTVRSIAR